MLHEYTGASAFPRDMHFWYYAVVFFTVCLVLTHFVSRGIVLIVVACLSVLLHLKASIDRATASVTLTTYGAVLAYDRVKDPFRDVGEGFVTNITFRSVRDATWCWLHALPVISHNLTALDEFYTDVYISLVTGLCLCLFAFLILHENFPCRYPEIFATITHHAGLCLWSRSWFCAFFIFPAHALFVLKAPGGLAWKQHLDDVSNVSDAVYQAWRRDTSPCIPVPRTVYTRIPKFLKISFLHETF